MVDSRRLTLCPHGLPLGARQFEHCQELIHRAGGDLQRIVDGPTTSIEHFTRHIFKIQAVRQARVPPLVVLTQANPLGLSVVTARRRLESLLPGLAQSPWLIHFDPTEDPFLLESAQAQGVLDTTVERDMPIWTDADGRRYLIVSYGIEDMGILPQRLFDLAEGGMPVSRLRASKSSGAMQAVLSREPRTASSDE